MPDPNSNNDSVSAGDIDVAVYLEARNQEFLYNSLPTIFYISFLSVMGLVGNSVVFMVYYKRYHASSAIRYYVLAMSVTDMLTNAQILSAEVLEMRFHNTFRWGWACSIFRLTRSFLVGFSILLLVAVAVNRKQVCSLKLKNIVKTASHDSLSLV
ncbi:hypothetical protein V1264_009687 [Littorina saxatilis]|uniref:G-protein coupled receptors family 1 profile domain-containing protein n=1 Tax=Littorina saxatilis TaxID=31220 RepID=A0AAN9ARY4_9CAEN